MRLKLGVPDHQPSLANRYLVPAMLTLLLVGGGWAYLDLRAQVRELGARVTHSVPAAAPRETAPPTDGVCRGHLPREAVHDVLGRRGRGVFECHLASGTPAMALVRLTLRVSAEGEIDQVDVDGTSNRALLDCIRSEVETWQFPSPDGSSCAIVEAPFMLGSGSANGALQ